MQEGQGGAQDGGRDHTVRFYPEFYSRSCPCRLPWTKQCSLERWFSLKAQNRGIYSLCLLYPGVPGVWSMSQKVCLSKTMLTWQNSSQLFSFFISHILGYDQNELYHTPSYPKIWDLSKEKKLWTIPFPFFTLGGLTRLSLTLFSRFRWKFPTCARMWDFSTR